MFPLAGCSLLALHAIISCAMRRQKLCGSDQATPPDSTPRPPHTHLARSSILLHLHVYFHPHLRLRPSSLWRQLLLEKSNHTSCTVEHLGTLQTRQFSTNFTQTSSRNRLIHGAEDKPRAQAIRIPGLPPLKLRFGRGFPIADGYLLFC